jgi:hypothetical protein
MRSITRFLTSTTSLCKSENFVELQRTFEGLKAFTGLGGFFERVDTVMIYWVFFDQIES